PMPTTTTVCPGRTSPRVVADPQPVATPHDTTATASSGMSGSTLITDDSATHVYWANVPSLANSSRSSSPIRWRLVPSVIMPSWNVARPLSHNAWRPVEHIRQRPHDGMNDDDTWSPGRTDVTSGPTSTTTPAPS